MNSSPRLTARIAGLLYLITIIGGVIGFAVGSSMMVRGDAAATAAKILASEPLLRLGFTANLVAAAAYIGVTVILYKLLKPVNRTVALLAAAFSLTGCAVGAAISSFQLAPLLLLGGSPYLGAFTPDQLQALALTSLRMHVVAHNIGMVFFGLYCGLLGYLVWNAGFLPRIIGAALALTGFCYLTSSLAVFLAPAVAGQLFPWILMPAMIGEGGLTLWLLIMGVDAEKWRERAAAADAHAGAR